MKRKKTKDPPIPIPAACITVEAAELITRFWDRKKNVKVHLTMGCQNLDKVPSRNIIAEIKGSEKPEEVVVAGGHVDSWDVGTGAHDDGQAVIVTWEALRLIKALVDKEPSFRPRRTIRFVGWTDEECRSSGAKEYHRKVEEEKNDGESRNSNRK